VRGLPQNRYVGRALVLWNAELRWERAEVRVLRVGFRPGVVVFLDSGRVWKDGVRRSELVRDHHRGAGAGLRLRLGESFLVAADLGRSSGHPVGFYLGVGHRF
jgi:hemolysin activation/secretion protein